jgi:hypothetical protein
LGQFGGNFITSGILNGVINDIQTAYINLELSGLNQLVITLNDVSGIVANSEFYTIETYSVFEVAYNSGLTIVSNITSSGVLAEFDGVLITNTLLANITNAIITQSGLLEKEVIQQHLSFQFDAQNILSYSGVGAVWNNLSGSNDITLSGATFVSAYGGVMRFDGSNDEAFIDAAVPAPTVISLELWFRTDQTSAFAGNLIAFQEYKSSTSGAHDRSLFLSGTNESATLNFYVYSSGSSNVLSSNPLTLTEWNHVVATFEYFDNSGLLQLYVNGEFSSSGLLTGNLFNYPEPGFWRLGSSPSLNGQGFYEGDISEVRIYDVALTPAQVAHNFEQSKDISEAAIFILDANNPLSYSNPPSTVTLSGVDVNTTSGVFVFDREAGEHIDTGIEAFIGDYTIEIWFNAATGSTNEINTALFSDEETKELPDWNHRLMLNGSELYFDQKLESTIELTLLSEIEENEWYYAVITNSGNTVSTYLNGQFINSGIFQTNQDLNRSIFIGASPGPVIYNYPFAGQIGPVKYYDRALSSQEVLVNFNQSSSRFSND